MSLVIKNWNLGCGEHKSHLQNGWEKEWSLVFHHCKHTLKPFMTCLCHLTNVYTDNRLILPKPNWIACWIASRAIKKHILSMHWLPCRLPQRKGMQLHSLDLYSCSIKTNNMLFSLNLEKIMSFSHYLILRTKKKTNLRLTYGLHILDIWV